MCAPRLASFNAVLPAQAASGSRASDHGQNRGSLPEGSLQRSCWMVGCLARDGIPISRERIRNLMQRNGLWAIYQHPRTTISRGSIRAPSLHGRSRPTHSRGSGMGHRNHHHPITDGVSVSGGDHGSLLQARIQHGGRTPHGAYAETAPYSSHQ